MRFGAVGLANLGSERPPPVRTMISSATISRVTAVVQGGEHATEDVPMQLPKARTDSMRLRKGTWTPEEDLILRKCIEKYGEGEWHLVPTRAGLRRCRKSCRLRWLNYLKPSIKRGTFDEGEVDLIVRLHGLLGNRWSLIAGRIPGRTANDIKNYWNSPLGRKASANSHGVVHNKVTAVETNPSALTEKSYPPKQAISGGGHISGGSCSFVIKPKARTPSKAAFPLPTTETCHKTSCGPPSADEKPANVEDLLSWLRNMLGDEGEERVQQQQQWAPGNIDSFPSSNQAEAGDAGLLVSSPWTEEIEGCGQWGWWEDIFLEDDLPLGLLQPVVDRTSQAPHGVDHKHE